MDILYENGLRDLHLLLLLRVSCDEELEASSRAHKHPPHSNPPSNPFPASRPGPSSTHTHSHVKPQPKIPPNTRHPKIPRNIPQPRPIRTQNNQTHPCPPHRHPPRTPIPKVTRPTPRVAARRRPRLACGVAALSCWRLVVTCARADARFRVAGETCRWVGR